MGEIQVPYHTCDLPGCGNQWPAGVINGNLEVILGIHPEIVKAREEPVIVQKRVYRFCPNHAEKVKWPLIAVAKYLGGVVGSDLLEGMGCWITVWHHHGGFIQQDLNHQLPYEVFELIYSQIPEAYLRHD